MDSRFLGMIAELGPAAAPVAPKLVALMKDRDLGRDVPEVLGRIGKEVIPSLRAALPRPSPSWS